MKYEKINDTHFVHMDDTKAVLKLAIQTGKNLILYGPGGYGKSDLVKFTLDALKIKYNYVVGDKTMPPEKLLGTVDFTKLTEESEFRVAFEKSPFLGAEVLVLEEFLDVAPDTAAALKDVISSGGHKYKDIFIPSDVKLVIITSNKAPDELATNDSLKAFYNERFLLHHRVDWEVKSARMYSDLLRSRERFGEVDKEDIKLLSFLFESAKVSPRIALDTADIYINTHDLVDLKFIPDFKAFDLKTFDATFTKKKNTSKFMNSLHKINSLANNFRDNLGVLLWLNVLIDRNLDGKNLVDERSMSLLTVKNSISLKITAIHDSHKDNVNFTVVQELNDVFRDY